VTFPSGAPDVSPLVTHEGMTHPEDLARAKEAVALARRIGGSQAFSQPTEAIENGAGAPDMWTAVYDGRGTCRMGREEHNSVVDHKLRVHGITGLRVVDGSVIPVGSPYLAVPEVLALAERASELLVNHHTSPEAAAAAVSAVGVPDKRVTIDRLADTLGSGFSMMQAITHLAGEQSMSLLQAPQSGPSPFAPGAFAVIMGAMGLFAATSIMLMKRGAAKKSQEDKYAVLLA